MATAKKLPSGNYRVRAYVGNGVYKSFTAATKAKAERAASEYIDNHVGAKGTMTLERAIQIYITSREAALSPSTIRGYVTIQRELLKNHKELCNTSIDLITSLDIQRVITDLIERKRTPKTVRNYHGLISSAMSLQGVRMPDIRLPEKIQSDIYIPSESLVKRLVGLVKGTELELPVLLAISIPARRGEICGLRAEDLDGNVIHIHRSIAEDKNYEWVEKSPKTYESDRFVALPDDIAEMFRKKGCATTLTPDEVSAKFRWLLKKNGLPHFRFHDLRHFGCSYMHSIGIPDAYIQKRGGWSTDSVMKKIYRHTLADAERESNEKIQANMGTLFENI